MLHTCINSTRAVPQYHLAGASLDAAGGGRELSGSKGTLHASLAMGAAMGEDEDTSLHGPTCQQGVEA